MYTTHNSDHRSKHNTGENLPGFGVGKCFLGLQKAQGIKEKIDKLVDIKI
jgi:hypothetical protein